LNRVLAEYRRPDGRLLQAVQGDLTREEVDAIVNAANSHLAHGGGVAGAIVRRGGREIQEESDRLVRDRGPVPPGEAVVTGAGRLPARYVIHAVGPIWQGRGDEPDLLRRAVQSALARAEEQGVATLSLPAISTGIFGFPKGLGVQVILQAVQDYLDAHPDTSIRQVRFCNIDRETAERFASALQALGGRAVEG